MTLTFKRGIVLLAAVVLAGACGPSGTSGGTTESPSPSPSPSPVRYAIADVCALVTEADASTAVGTPVKNLSATGGVAIPGACFFGTTDSSNVGVFIFAQTYADAATADQVQPDQFTAALGGRLGVTNAHSVTGIGDKAFEYSATGSGGNGIAIFVFKGNAVIFIILSPTTDSAKVEQLAMVAVGNLKPA